MNRKTTFFLGSTVILRIILSIFLWNHSGGFFWLTSDDVYRMELAHLWSRAPYFDYPGNPLWLPLGFWIHGIALKFVDDPLMTSSAVNSTFSIASILLIYRITETLFPGGPSVPLLAAAIFGFSPLLVWLGLSGLSEAVFHLLMLTGILFWLSASRNKRPILYLCSSIGFLGASMIRYEAWILAPIFVAFSVLDLKGTEHKVRILFSAALAVTFIPIWLCWQWYNFGDPLHFTRYFTMYSARSGLSEYARLLWGVSPFVIALALVGIAASIRRGEETGRYLSFMVVFYLAFILIMRGNIALVFPIRNLTSVFLLLIPFAAYGANAIMMKLPFPSFGMSLLTLAFIVVGAMKSFHYSFYARDDLVKMAICTRQIVQGGPLPAGSRILLQSRRGGPNERDVWWDSQLLHAVSPSKILYDRKPDWRNRNGEWVINEVNNPSILDGPPRDVENRLRSQRIRVVIAYSEPVFRTLEAFMNPVLKWKEYRIYGRLDGELRRNLPYVELSEGRVGCIPILSQADVRMEPHIQEGFERPEISKWDWENWEGGFSITSRHRWEGSRALELRASRASGFRLLQHRRIEVHPGALYVARVKVRAEQLLGPGVGIYMSTYRTAEDWKQLSSGHSIIPPGRGWQETSLVFSPPDGAHFLLVGLGGRDLDGVAQFDNFELREAEAAAR